MKDRNVNIDLIKSIACLGILGLHCIGFVNYTLYYICTFAVPVFFMVNGFLMFSKKEVTVKYCGSKILSLLRIIVIWNLIIFIPMMILKHKFINPLEQIYKCLLQQGYLWHFWFFGALAILYILLVPIHKLVINPKYGMKIHIALCIFLFLICLVNTAYSYYTHYPAAIGIPQSLRIWISLFYYLLGGLISRMKETNFFNNIKLFPLIVFTILWGIVCNYGQKHLGLYGYSQRAAEYFYDEFTVIIWCIAIFVMLSKINIPTKLKLLVIGFSNLTLGIFIIHPLLLKASEILFIPKTTPQAIAVWGGITLLSVSVSYIINKIHYINKLTHL